MKFGTHQFDIISIYQNESSELSLGDYDLSSYRLLGRFTVQGISFLLQNGHQTR